MLNPSILSLALLSAPNDVALPRESDDFADRLDSVDVTVSDTDAMVVALDESGQPIGSIALWVDDSGTTWIAADYADGYAVLQIDPFTNIVTREGDLPPAVLAERADAILFIVGDPAKPAEKKKHSWTECGAKTVLAGFACWTGGPIGCVLGGIKAGCACVPKVIKEFEPYECPWGL